MSSASFFVILSFDLMVLVVSNISISPGFSVINHPVFSSTYLCVPPPPPLPTSKKSPHPSTFPETIFNPSTAVAVYLSPPSLSIYLFRRIFNAVSLFRRPSYRRGSIPFRDSQASNLRIYASHYKSSVFYVSTTISCLSSSPDRVTHSSHRLFPTVSSCLAGLYAIGYTTDIEAASSQQCFCGAKQYRLILRFLVTAGSIVQECYFARFTHDYFIAASLSHYTVSSIDISSQNRICGLPDLLVAGTIVQECGLARFSNYITAASPSQYAVSSIDGSSQSQLCDLQTGGVTQRPTHPEAFYLLSDVCSHTFWLNKCDDCTLRSPSVTNYWSRHGNVEFRALYQVREDFVLAMLSTVLELLT
ncbi:hypothetical protein Bca101_056792 [Brassica carinata]